MHHRLASALIVSLWMAVGILPIVAQPTPTPDEKEIQRLENLRLHDQRVKAIVKERHRLRTANLASPDSATSAPLVIDPLSPQRQERLLEHDARVKVILAERALARTLSTPDMAAEWRADTAARRQRFEKAARENMELVALATEAANARAAHTDNPQASPELVDQEMGDAIARVYKREDRVLEAAPGPDLDVRMSLILDDADTDQAAQEFARKGITLRFEGAPKAVRFDLATSDLRAALVVQSFALQTGGTAWLLPDNSILITDAQPPAGAKELLPALSVGTFPELEDPSSDREAARLARRLSMLMYTEYVRPGAIQKAHLPTEAPAQPVDPPLDSSAVFTAS